MAKKRIFVDKNGNVRALYDDKFAGIRDYGEQQIHRASTLEYDNDFECWMISMPPIDQLDLSKEKWPQFYAAATRAESLQYEKELLENRYKKQLIDGNILVTPI